jgi:hypothetical protein
MVGYTPTMIDTSMATKQSATRPTWMGRSKARLLLDVVGGLSANVNKLIQLVGLFAGFALPGLVRKRLERLEELGHIHQLPTIAQMLVAARDQMMLSAVQETKIFYRSQGIPWVFHNIRRFIAGPATMMDPMGLFSTRDAIIEHILQTFHRHPVYDFVLLRAHERGMEEMELQTRAVLDGSHPSSQALRSLIEDGSYHRRLLVEIKDFNANPMVLPRPIPAGLVPDPHMMLGMDQFKDLEGFTSYAARLQVTMKDAARAWGQVAFNETLGPLFGKRLGNAQISVGACEPELVAYHLPAAAATPEKPAPL